MAGRRHLMAVNRTILAMGLDKSAAASATVDFARNLARRMDAVSSSGAPLTLVSAYQSALKDLNRAGVRVGAAKSVREIAESKPVDVLEAFYRKWRVRPEDRA